VEAKAEAAEGVRLGARRRTYKRGAHNRASCGPPDAPAELEGVSEARRQLADAPHGVTARPARRGWARLGAWRPSQLCKLSSRRWTTHALWLRLLAIAGRPAAQVWASDMRHIRRRLSPRVRRACCAAASSEGDLAAQSADTAWQYRRPRDVLHAHPPVCARPTAVTRKGTPKGATLVGRPTVSGRISAQTGT
jgi:hypothetical protein